MSTPANYLDVNGNRVKRVKRYLARRHKQAHRQYQEDRFEACLSNLNGVCLNPFSSEQSELFLLRAKVHAKLGFFIQSAFDLISSDCTVTRQEIDKFLTYNCRFYASGSIQIAQNASDLWITCNGRSKHFDLSQYNIVALPFVQQFPDETPDVVTYPGEASAVTRLAKLESTYLSLSQDLQDYASLLERVNAILEQSQKADLSLVEDSPSLKRRISAIEASLQGIGKLDDLLQVQADMKALAELTRCSNESIGVLVSRVARLEKFHGRSEADYQNIDSKIKELSSEIEQAHLVNKNAYLACQVSIKRLQELEIYSKRQLIKDSFQTCIAVGGPLLRKLSRHSLYLARLTLKEMWRFRLETSKVQALVLGLSFAVGYWFISAPVSLWINATRGSYLEVENGLKPAYEARSPTSNLPVLLTGSKVP